MNQRSANSQTNHEMLQEMSLRMVASEGNVAALRADLNDVKSAISKLTEAWHGREKTNWGLVLALIGCAGTFLAGGWYLIKLQTDNAIAPIMALTSVSHSERAAMREDIRRNTDTISAIRGDQRDFDAQMQARLTEVETQFRAADSIRNIDKSNINRMIGLLWQQAFSAPLPADGYYPTIAQPH